MSVTSDASERSQVLRQELKQWEQQFALTNGGRKASREEIKADGKIAAKYREYNRLRDIISGKAQAPPKPTSPMKPKTTRPAPQERIPVATPSRKSSRAHTAHPRSHITPSKTSRNNTTMQNTNDTEDVENIKPFPAFIGPTPQKDGRVLGLFDLLSPIAQRVQTPSKRGVRDALGDISNGNGNARGNNRGAAAATPKTDRYCASLDAVAEDSGVDVDENGQRQGTRGGVQEQGEVEIGAETPSSKARYSRTPQSAGKRFLLDSFVQPSPSKRRRIDDSPSASRTTPRSITQHPTGDAAGFSRAGLATPAFLRRHTDMSLLPILAEDLETEEHEHEHGLGLEEAEQAVLQSPSKRPSWLRRRSAPALSSSVLRTGMGRTRMPGMTRSLSSMIADIRKAEEDKLDEEMDLLREFDGDGDFNAPPTIAPEPKIHTNNTINTSFEMAVKSADTAQVEDSQPPSASDLKLLGPDAPALSDEEEEVMLGRNGQPLRVWKKKGLKRQTKRVNMRPATRPKTAQQDQSLADADSEEDGGVGVGDVDIVAETQLPDDLPDHNDDDEDCDGGDNNDESGSEFSHNDDDDEEDAEHNLKKPFAASKQKANSNTTATAPAPQAPVPKEKDNFVKKAVKKISATAHANFRRLKIKSSKGAKAGVGGGRFGGRRFGRR